MANLALNQNQFSMSAIIGQVTADPQPRTLSCQLDPNSSWTGPITAGQAVKLTNTAGTVITVEPCSADTDVPFGVIAYNLRKSTLVLGDYAEIVSSGGVMLLKSSGAIARGDRVAVTNQTVATNDPTIATNTTTGKAIVGVALGKATAADQLIKVLIQPGLNSGAGANAVAGVVGAGF